MEVRSTGEKSYAVTVCDSEQLIICELAKIYGMSCDEIVKMMFSFSSHMAVSRIINEINKG